MASFSLLLRTRRENRTNSGEWNGSDRIYTIMTIQTIFKSKRFWPGCCCRKTPLVDRSSRLRSFLYYGAQSFLLRNKGFLSIKNLHKFAMCKLLKNPQNSWKFARNFPKSCILLLSESERCPLLCIRKVQTKLKFDEWTVDTHTQHRIALDQKKSEHQINNSTFCTNNEIEQRFYEMEMGKKASPGHESWCWWFMHPNRKLYETETKRNI